MRIKMMKQTDWTEYERLLKEMVSAGVNETLAKVIAYEKLKGNEVYSPFETINS